jgi:tight adherence protein B
VRRLALVVALATACGLLAHAAAGASQSRLRVIEAKGPGFPVKTYVLSLPDSRELTANDVAVTENGGNVADVSVVPASAASRRSFGVVLVVDASDSMAGVPIAQAVAAERSFASRRNPNQQLGLIAFDSKTRVVLPLTTSKRRISSALQSPPKVAFGTHIYDAVAKAEAMLARAHIGSGSIVVLSDGADTGSRATVAGVAATARAGHVRLFTIGLQSKTFKPASLQSLAVAGGGDYTLANSTSDLEPVFAQISQLLSREYLLSYKSLAGPSVPMKVQVRVRGVGTAATAYKSPALPTVSAPSPYHASIGSRILGSTATIVLLALFVAGVVALLVIALLQPRRSGLPERMSEFVTVPGLRHDQRRARKAEKRTGPEQETRWTRFGKMLEIAQIDTSPSTLVVATATATVLGYLLLYVVTGSFWWALFALLIPFAVREWVVRTLARRRNRFAEQLPDALQVISSALRSGHSFAGALAVVVESASEPMKSEMQRVVADEQRGIPLQQSLLVVADRMQSADLEQLALVAELQREAGGNAAEVVDRVAETVRERFEVQRLVQTLTVQGRMSRWIVSAIPVVIIVLLQLINPHYLHPLLASTAGKVVFGFAAALVVTGSLVIKKIVDIEI